MSKGIPLDDMAYKRITGLYQLDKNIIEFTKNDDLLFVKWNGQLISSLTYNGNNTFEDGFDKVSFELLHGGGTKATFIYENKTYIAEKFLKYPD